MSPTTTAKFATRMLSAARLIAATLPAGYYGSVPLDILLALHIAEEDAKYLSIEELYPAGNPSRAITDRWLRLLEQQEMIERAGDLLALSTLGHTVISDLLVELYRLQRSLD